LLNSRRVFIKAKLVVSAAGALHTPALLLRSGLSHRGMVGAYLTLHPVLGVAGVFPEEEVGVCFVYWHMSW
jgi:long-chain-alcohol oxidase